MYFSVTERGTFKRCRRQAVLTSKNGQHLAPLTAPVYLSTGTLVHKGHQEWLKDPTTPLRTHMMSAAVAMEAKVKRQYTARVGTQPFDTELEPLYEAIGFAVAMGENYQKRWGTPLPDGFIIIQAEQRIQIPIWSTRSKCGGCGGAGHKTDFVANAWMQCPDCRGSGEEVHYLDFRLDGLVQRLEDGALLVLERKTYNNRPKEDSLRATDQFLAYLWGTMQLGIPVAGMLYDGMWRRKEVPRGKTFEDLFLRLAITRTKEELEEFERFLPMELNDMAALYRNPDTAYTSRVWQGCWDCKMEPLCEAMSKGGDVEYIRNKFYTLRDDDTDEDGDEAATA